MSLKAKSVNVNTLCQLGTRSWEQTQRTQGSSLPSLEGLWGMERDWLEHGKVKESGNKKISQWEEMLQLKTCTVCAFSRYQGINDAHWLPNTSQCVWSALCSKYRRGPLQLQCYWDVRGTLSINITVKYDSNGFSLPIKKKYTRLFHLDEYV